MISFISGFNNYLKRIRPILLALLLISAIELAVYVLGGHEVVMKRIYRTTFLNYTFQKASVHLSEELINAKGSFFFDSNAEFLQIGDSSGLYSLKPSTVKTYLEHKNYINANGLADVAWDGYISVAQHYFRNVSGIKYLVLYVTPYSLPAAAKKKFGDKLSLAIGNAYSPLWHYFYQMPSLYFRKELLEKAYFIDHRQIKQHSQFLDNFIARQKVEEGYKNLFAKELGWIPLNRSSFLSKMPRGDCGADIEEFYGKKPSKPTLFESLQKIKKFADQKKVELIVIFNPVACKISPAVSSIVLEVDKFQKKNPDVFIPFGVINTKEEWYFADQWHLNPIGAEIFSHEVGLVLKKFLYDKEKRQR